jgi:hypothetical protein
MYPTKKNSLPRNMHRIAPACVRKNNKAIGTEWDFIMTTDQLTDACMAAGIVFAVPTQNNPAVLPPITQNTTNSTKSFVQAVQELLPLKRCARNQSVKPWCQFAMPHPMTFPRALASLHSTCNTPSVGLLV